MCSLFSFTVQCNDGVVAFVPRRGKDTKAPVFVRSFQLEYSILQCGGNCYGSWRKGKKEEKKGGKETRKEERTTEGRMDGLNVKP